MKINLSLPWERYVLIGALAAELAGREFGVFGKTHLQKLVYFLQELKGVDCGYDFTLYTYGPFSAKLLSDLDVADGMGVVALEYLPHAGAYDIRPGPSLERARHKAVEFLEAHRSEIADVAREFGDLRAKDLELRATIVYVDRDARRRAASLSLDRLAEAVQGIKPHFSLETVRRAVEEMRAAGYVLA